MPAEEVREALKEGEVARAAGLIAPDVALIGAIPFTRKFGLGRRVPVKPTPKAPIAPTSRQLPAARIQVPIQSTGEVPLGQIRTTAPIKQPAVASKLGVPGAQRKLLQPSQPTNLIEGETVTKTRVETGLARETRGVLVTTPEQAQQIVARTRKALFTRRGTLRAKEAKRLGARERIELERTFKQLEEEVRGTFPPSRFKQGKFVGGLIRKAATETPELAAATVDRLPVGALNSPTLTSILEEFPTLRKTIPSAGETTLSEAVRNKFGALQNSKVLGKPLLGYFRTEIQRLRQQGVTAAQFAQRLEFHLSNSAFSVGPWKARLANISQGLSEAEQRNLVQVVRGKSRSLNPAINTKAGELRKIFSEVREEAIKRKVEIQTSEGRFIPFSAVPDNPIYFPQKIKPEFFGKGIEAAAKKMVAHGSAPDIATAERTLQKFVYPRAVRIAGNIERAQVFDLPRSMFPAIQRLRQQGVTAAQFAQRLEFHLSNSAFSVGPWKARLANISQGLSEAEQRNLVQVVRGKSRSLNPAINTKAGELRKIFSEVREEAIKRKVEIQTSEGRFIPFSAVPDNPIYFPQKIKPEFFGKGIEAAAKKMVAHGSAPDIATAERTLQKFVYPRAVRIAGNIERAKVFDLPDDLLRLDLSAADEYLSQVGETFSRTEVFGQRPNKLLSQP